MNLLVRMVGLTRMIAFFNLFAGTADKKTEEAVQTVGEWALSEIRRMAPRGARSGYYASTIEGFFSTSSSFGSEYVIGTDEPYGARLEFGFQGVDSLGRRVSQGPRPHFTPVAAAIPARLITHINQAFS